MSCKFTFHIRVSREKPDFKWYMGLYFGCKITARSFARFCGDPWLLEELEERMHVMYITCMQLNRLGGIGKELTL